ncbi:DUF6702 family protein [Chondrinema litorale]|uniref:DUF6702 family protein n=1 Tax=Chondrinema litorale TaxID=2994555 RepID=UPI0025433E76|nr:DUF6702 family protein [Chondrinema litorale]UZR98956.1 hypothetical protein OQ292_34465 [Chondrinema litorale]
MKKSIMVLFTIFLSLSAVTTKAHQPNISSFILIEKDPELWMLQLNASITAFEYEVKNEYGKDSYNSTEEFNQLLLKHLKEQITIKINDKNVPLKNGRVQLGHSTTIVFDLAKANDGITEEIFVKNNSFQNIYNSQTIFSIIKEEFDRTRSVLNKKNDFQISVSLIDHQFIMEESPKNDIWFILFSLAVLIVIGIYSYSATATEN